MSDELPAWALMTKDGEIACNSNLFLIFTSEKVARDRLKFVTTPIALRVQEISLIGYRPTKTKHKGGKS